MDERLLYYFTVVVEKKTMVEASKILHITQPSLSVAIKKLEAELGFTLFNREARNLSLTEQGVVFYNEAKQLMNHFAHLKREVERIRDEGPLHISIGIIESTKYWLPKMMDTFVTAHPNITFKINEVLGHTSVKEALENFHIHFAITNQSISTPFTASFKIYEERLVALLPNQHHLTHQSTITLSDLKDEPFIICEKGFQTREDTLQAFRQKEITPYIKYEMERFETVCSFVEAGLGVTILPENYVKYSANRDYIIKHIGDVQLKRAVYISYAIDRKLPPIVEELISMIKQFFREEG